MIKFSSLASRFSNSIAKSGLNQNFIAKSGLILVLIIYSFVIAEAAPPQNPEFLNSKPKTFKPCNVMSKESLRRLQYMGIIRSTAKSGVKTKSTNSILVIRVQFPESSITTSKSHCEELFENLKNYYEENSYGLLSVSATVTSSVYTLSNIYLYNNETENNLKKLLQDSINACKNDVNFSLYDHVMINHAGYGEEQSGNPDDLWSLFYDYTFTAGSKYFNGFTVVPDASPSNLSPLGVVCHEYGHQLGLPDLYNTTVAGGISTCGAWSLMDYPYGSDHTGKNPSHLDPWCKNFLRFIDLDARKATESINSAVIGDIESSPTTGYYKIPIEVASSDEYFIIEYRKNDASKNKFDLSIPGSGLLIWHIDDSIALSSLRIANGTVNEGTPHLGVDLVESDGITRYPPGKASDAYTQGDIFKSPESNTFNGSISNIVLTNINVSQDQISCLIKKIAASSNVSVSKIINYPNPSGLNCYHPRKNSNGTITTILAQCTKPPDKIDLTIFTLSGEMVLKINKDAFNLNVNPSMDYKWVFEFDWNGRNQSNEDVAQGVYLYRINADGDIKIGKLAVMR